MMQAQVRTLYDLFNEPVRYVVPIYQRPYVWQVEGQANLLWDDVERLADRFLELHAERGIVGPDDIQSHFLGAIVLQALAYQGPGVPALQIIDGQQRLTTLQLLLDAAQEEFFKLQDETAAEQLRPLILNPDDAVVENPDQTFKVWPSEHDRPAFRHAMRNDLPSAEYANSDIVLAHDHFKASVRQWVEADPGALDIRGRALVHALKSQLKVVAVALEVSEDSHMVFETLNARGTPLSATDLVRNYVLRAAGDDSEETYDRYLRSLADAWWREALNRGGSRHDDFLHAWLTLRTCREIGRSRLFEEFRQYAEPDRPISDVAADLHDTADLYREINELMESKREPETEFERFVEIWNQLDARSWMPVLLALRQAAVDDAELARGCEAIESFLVRRVFCDKSSKDYNSLVLRLLGAMRDGTGNPVESLIKQMRAETAAGAEWPDDRALEWAFRDEKQYPRARRRLTFLLGRMNHAMASARYPLDPNLPRCTIEHVMPQEWRRSRGYRLPKKARRAAEAMEEERDRIIHTIGNLTLLPASEQATVSNRSWSAKRRVYRKPDMPPITQELAARVSGEWNEGAIDRRAKRLCKVAIRLWPGPDKF